LCLIFKDWNWVFIICGTPGVFVAVVTYLTIKEPKKDAVPATTTSLSVAEESNWGRQTNYSNLWKLKQS
jgi:hypothetical protein